MNPYDQSFRAFDEIHLERQTYARRQEIEDREIQNVKRHGHYQDFMDHARRCLVMEMRMDIYGKRHPDRHVIRYPADWWQAVKERFAPAWFRDKYPVVFTEVTASLNETYPDIQPALPDREPVLRFIVASKPEYYTW